MRKALVFILFAGIAYVWAGTKAGQSNPQLLIDRIFEAFEQMAESGMGVVTMKCGAGVPLWHELQPLRLKGQLRRPQNKIKSKWKYEKEEIEK